MKNRTESEKGEGKREKEEVGREKGEVGSEKGEVRREKGGVEGGAKLLDEVAEVLRRFVVLPKCGAETLALWVLHTYAFEWREVSTYIGIESPEKRCGKTTLLEVLSRLVNRPVVAANVSPSAFFRVIEETRPTLLIDEADTFLQGNDELRGVLNTGYRRDTGYVLRVASGVKVGSPKSRVQSPKSEVLECGVRSQESGVATEREKGEGRRERGEAVQPATGSRVAKQSAECGGGPPASGFSAARNEECVEAVEVTGGDWAVAGGGGERGGGRGRGGSGGLVMYSCWCPKAIAAIGRLPDTLADRCIIIRMERRRPDEECERLRKLDGAALRERCRQFVREHGQAIGEAEPEIPEELNDRAADIWEPLLALADLAGGEWPAKAREAAACLSANAQERNPIGSLLFDIFCLFAADTAERKFTRDLVEGLNMTFTDRPWADLTRVRTAEARQGVTERWLAQQLRPYGLRPRTMRIGEKLGKGYLFQDFLEVFKRYVPMAELEEFREETREMRKEKGEGRREKGEVRNEEGGVTDVLTTPSNSQ